MGGSNRSVIYGWRSLRRLWPWLLVAFSLCIVRWSKGAVFLDTYAFLTRPFWPGTAQRDWIKNGTQLEQESRLRLLEADNQRLRAMLSLKSSSKAGLISAAVISRSPNGWWQQIVLGKGSTAGIAQGDAVLGPGGLIGIIQSVTPITARVRLLTAPGSRIGVWNPRTKRHGILLGIGTNRPVIRFLDKDSKDSKSLSGDLLSTSPASTILPPNLPVGLIQTLDEQAIPAPEGIVQLIAAPEAIDWVQIQKF